MFFHRIYKSRGQEPKVSYANIRFLPAAWKENLNRRSYRS